MIDVLVPPPESDRAKHNTAGVTGEAFAAMNIREMLAQLLKRFSAVHAHLPLIQVDVSSKQN